MRLKVTFAFLGLCLMASAPAQSIFEQWKVTEPIESYVDLGAFAKNGRTVHIKRDLSNNRVVCREPNGALAWTYSLPMNYYARNILTTTDNRIYLTLDPASHNAMPMVVSITQDGTLDWTYTFNLGNAPRALYEMRIFGDRLLIGATGRTGIFGTDPKLCLLALNRLSGGLLYGREYMFGTIGIAENIKLRSNGSQLFLFASRQSPNFATGVLKIDPASGDPLAMYASSPFRGDDIQVDSTSAVYLTGYVASEPWVPETRKLNGSGSTFTLVYRKPYGGADTLLSAGNLYMNYWRNDGTTGYHGIRKTRASDGAVLWERESVQFPGYTFMSALRADAQGRIVCLTQNYAPTGVKWGVRAINPATGSTLQDFTVAERTNTEHSNTFPRTITLNSMGDIFVTGSLGFGTQSQHKGVTSVLFMPMVPVNDTFTIADGGTLTAPSVLANDKATNPYLTEVTVIQTPQKGVLDLNADGTFTYTARDNGQLIGAGPQVFRYRAQRGSVTAEGQVTINIERGVVDFTLARYKIAGAGSISGVVTMSSPGTNSTVTLTENSPYVSVPASITIPSTQTTGNLLVTASEVSASETVPIVASFGGTSKAVSLLLQPLALSTISAPQNVTGGNTIPLVIQLNGKAGTGGVTVEIRDDNAFVSAPATATVPPGASSMTVHIPTTAPTSPQRAQIVVTALGTTLIRFVNVNP